MIMRLASENRFVGHLTRRKVLRTSGYRYQASKVDTRLGIILARIGVIPIVFTSNLTFSFDPRVSSRWLEMICYRPVRNYA